MENVTIRNGWEELIRNVRPKHTHIFLKYILSRFFLNILTYVFYCINIFRTCAGLFTKIRIRVNTSSATASSQPSCTRHTCVSHQESRCVPSSLSLLYSCVVFPSNTWQSVRASVLQANMLDVCACSISLLFSPFFLDVVCTSLHVRWWTCSGVCCVLVCVSFVFKCLYLHVCSFRGALVGTLGSYQVLFAPFSWEPMRFYLVAVKMNRQSQ